MDSLVANENAQKAVDGLFAVSGVHGLFENDDLERYYRDVRIGTLVANQTPDLVREWLGCLLYTSPSPRDGLLSRMPSSA